MPASLKLGHFAREVHEAFGHSPYLVGSALRGKKWRDVDVRLILPDEDYAWWFGGPPSSPRCLNLRWNAFCLAFATRGREITGLPIDFQIDQQTEANEKYDKPRSWLGLIHELGTSP